MYSRKMIKILVLITCININYINSGGKCCKCKKDIQEQKSNSFRENKNVNNNKINEEKKKHR